MNVAVEDVNNDGPGDILTGLVTGPTTAAVFRGTDLSPLETLMPFGTLRGGLYVG